MYQIVGLPYFEAFLLLESGVSGSSVTPLLLLDFRLEVEIYKYYNFILILIQISKLSSYGAGLLGGGILSASLCVTTSLVDLMTLTSAGV